jgi:antitoxin component of RelBE/YafQ-DinJ toxin-antitoxin module
MPNKPKTPTRAIRIEDELWRRAQMRAAERGETVSDAVRRFLERYVR